MLDTFRSIGSIQRRTALTLLVAIFPLRSLLRMLNVYKLARLAFANEEDVPVLDVIPLFEQEKTLRTLLLHLLIIQLPEVQARL